MKTIFTTFLLCLLSTSTQAEDTKVKQAIDWIMTSCVSSGTKIDISSNADDGISIRSTLNGNLGGEVQLSKTEITGLTDELNRLSLENANKVRDCTSPYRGTILNLILGISDNKNSEENSIKVRNGDFSLNLDKYEEGDIPEDIGSDIFIRKKENKKILSGMNSNPGGTIEFGGFSLKNNFSLEILTATDEASYILRSSDGNPENDIVIERDGHRLIFGESNKDAMSSGYDRSSNEVPNSFKLYAKDNAVKLYVNDNYFSSIKNNFNVEYGKIIIKGIGQNEFVSGINGFNL